MRRHLAALGLLLAVAWPLLDLDRVFTVDEGSYAVQARALGEGTWDMGYAFTDADPAREFLTYHGAEITDSEVIPYAKHPLVPVLMAAPAEVLGEQVGFRILGVGSVLALAAAAWSIAGELGRSTARPWAFWIAASSPVLANAFILWPHAHSSAVSAVLVLAALRSPRSRQWAAVAVGTAMAGALLRSEGVLFGAAIGGALIVAGPTVRSRLTGVGVGIGVAAALLVEKVWRSAILGDGATLALEDRGDGAFITGRLQGLRTALLDGAVGDEPAKALGIVVVVLTILAALRLRSPEPGRAAGLFLVAAAGALVARAVVASEDPVLGLFVAMPIGLLAFLWRPEARDRWVVVAALGFLLLLTASIYTDGGSFQYGGRFLAPLLGLLAATAGCTLAERLPGSSRAPESAGRIVLVGAVVLVAGQALVALIVPNEVRNGTGRRVDIVHEQPETVVIAGDRMIPRLDWRDWPDRCWISLYPEAGRAELEEILQVLRDSGVHRAAYAGIRAGLLREAGAAVRPNPTNPSVGSIELDAVAPRRVIAEPYSCPSDPANRRSQVVEPG